MAAKTKVKLRVATQNAAAGDELEVDSVTADYLVKNGHASRVRSASAEKKSDSKG